MTFILPSLPILLTNSYLGWIFLLLFVFFTLYMIFRG